MNSGFSESALLWSQETMMPLSRNEIIYEATVAARENLAYLASLLRSPDCDRLARDVIFLDCYEDGLVAALELMLDEHGFDADYYDGLVFDIVYSRCKADYPDDEETYEPDLDDDYSPSCLSSPREMRRDEERYREEMFEVLRARRKPGEVRTALESASDSEKVLLQRVSAPRW